MEIKIYKLIDPISDEIKYVGKTKNSLTKRLYEHFTKRNLSNNNHKNNWIKKLISLNLRPKIEIIETVTEQNWIEREMHWIKFYKDLGCNLTNTTDGGEGTKTYKMPPEATIKGIKTRRENGTLKRSEECKIAISKSKIGKIHTKEHTEANTSKTKYTILQYDLDYNLIKEWKGIRQCARELNLNHSSICRAIKLNISYNDFIWKYLIKPKRKNIKL